MMKKEVKVKRNIWNSIEGACGIKRARRLMRKEVRY